MLAFTGFVSAVVESKGSERPSKLKSGRSVFVSCNYLHVLLSVQRSPLSHTERREINKETYAQPPGSPPPCAAQVLKTNSPPSFLCFNWTTPAELLSDSCLKSRKTSHLLFFNKKKYFSPPDNQPFEITTLFMCFISSVPQGEAVCIRIVSHILTQSSHLGVTFIKTPHILGLLLLLYFFSARV